MKKLLLMAAAPLVFGSSAQAVVFDFDSDTPALNTTPNGFSVVQGTVDVVADNTFGIRCKGNAGNCLDLNGTSNVGGVVLSNSAFHVDAGSTYLVSLDVSGNQRGYAPDLFSGSLDFNPNITLSNLVFYVNGSQVGTLPSISTTLAMGQLTLASNYPWTNFAVRFTANGTSDFKLRLGTNANDTDNVGPVIDNFDFAAVPEPATWAMMIAGFGLVGGAMRRRHKASVSFA